VWGVLYNTTQVHCDFAKIVTPVQTPSVRWRRRLLIAAALLFGLWSGHAVVLRTLAGFLVVDESADDFLYVCVLARGHGPSGDRCYDAAVRLHRQRPSGGVLVIEPGQGRLVESGVLPSFEAMSRRELESRGLPWQTISAIRSEADDAWATARAVGAWLADHPDASAILLCSAFQSAHLRYALDAVLAPGQSARVRVRALQSRQYDQGNWWTRRQGIKAFAGGWLRLLHGWCVGGSCLPSPVRNADDYEDDVRQVLCGAEP
jgi:hypothetical protein